MTNPIFPTTAYRLVAGLLKLVKVGQDQWQAHEWSPERNAWVAAPIMSHMGAQTYRAERTHKLALLMIGWGEDAADQEVARLAKCGRNARDRIVLSFSTPK